MRYRLMASYLGASYQAAVGPSDRDVTLFAAPPPPEAHGFSPAPGGIWRKQVRLDDLDALWESRPIGSYHGEPCLVLDDLGDRVHIVYLGMDERRAAQLGYWEVDRGVFEVVVPRHDVSDLAEERHEFPVALLLSALAKGARRRGRRGRRTWRTRRQPERGGSRARGRGRKRVPGGDEQGHRRDRTRRVPRGAVPASRGRRAGPGGQGTGAMPGWNGPAGALPQRAAANSRRVGPRSFPRRCRSSLPSAGLQQPVTGGVPGFGRGRTAWASPRAPGMPGVPGMPKRRSWPTAAG